eukprot:scaffold41001_cov39-Phaeocystis_antarctica.AAC.1
MRRRVMRPSAWSPTCARWASGRKPRRWSTSTGWWLQIQIQIQIQIKQRPAEQYMKPPHSTLLRKCVAAERAFSGRLRIR